VQAPQSLAYLLFPSRWSSAGGQRLGLIEEQILLLRTSHLTLGSKQLALECLQLFLQQIPFDRHHTQLTTRARNLFAQRILFLGGDGDGGWHSELDRR
jgi:hypothetical protein